MRLHVFDRALEHVEISKSDGDSAYFLHLLYLGELFSKIATLAVVAAIADDSDRHRYALHYRIVRADGIGEWAQVINEAISGPTSQLFRPEFYPERRELNTRTTSETWQYRSVSLVDAALRILNPERPGLPSKLEARVWFSYFAELRNATRGHGAIKPSTSAKLATLLEESITLFIDNFCLFRREWAYLHKNLSGKYRVTKIGGDDESYKPLKSSSPNKWGILPDGVYFFGVMPIRVDLFFSDPDLTDYFLPNGNFRVKTFETISYLTNSKNLESGATYLVPSTQLPASETQGAKEVGVTGESFSNLPGLPHGYIKRTELEERLFELLTNDRHPVVSLIGRGGIGKTSLALDVLHRVCKQAKFAAIFWFSSRDIDLLPSGPKAVRAHLLDEKDMANEFAALLSQLVQKAEGEGPSELFARSLTKSPLEQPILFVFDNFETVSNPVQVYNWVDTYVRNPNKILITSRFREFKGDYPVDVPGMQEDESVALISQVSKQLRIEHLVHRAASIEIAKESDGHPYVIKMLLGEIARQGQLVQIERIVAGKDEVLDALFERSYVKLSPAAQLIFLTLSSWRSTIPRVAIEAVMLRPANERLDVEAALEELEQSSFIEIVSEHNDHQDFITVPLSAAVFGKKRLEVSPLKLSVEANMHVLLFFGAGQRNDLRHGIAPRIERFFRRVASETATDDKRFQQYLPILEYLSRQYSKGWLLIAQIHEERLDGNGKGKDGALDAVRHFLEASKDDLASRRIGWQHIVRLSKAKGDVATEVQGMIELASLPGAPFADISDTANRINNMGKLQSAQVAFDERNLLAEKILGIAIGRLEEADATDFSRLAWLSLTVGEEEQASQFIARGLALEANNDYCLRLSEKMAWKSQLPLL